MKGIVAASLVALMTAASLAAPPALGQPETRTQLVALGGKSVDRLQLRYDFDAAWVVDNQNVLYRDIYRDHYLVTLKQACEPLGIRRRPFDFFPAWSWELRASRSYEVRPQAGARCDVARIEQVDDARATALRDAAKWRAW